MITLPLPLAILFLALYPFLLLGVLVLAGWIISRLSGWAALAARYSEETPFAGPRFSGQSGELNGFYYGKGLTLGANREGFFLSMGILFRVGHKPLFIPWTDVTAVEKPGVLSSKVVLEFRGVPGVVLKFSKASVLKLKTKVGGENIFESIH